MRVVTLWVLFALAACSGDGTGPTPARRAAITVTFDDGRRGVATYARPLLDAMGLRANIAVMTTQYWDQQLPWDSLASLRAGGWSVVSHSMTHPLLTQLTPDSARREIRESRRVIDSLGFDDRIFIVPYLDHAPWVLAEAEAAGYHFTRCCVQDPAWSPDTLLDWPLAPAVHHRLVGLDVTDYGAPSAYNFRHPAGRLNIRALLADAVRRGKYVELVFHEITAADTADLRRTLELVAEHRPYVITFASLTR